MARFATLAALLAACTLIQGSLGRNPQCSSRPRKQAVTILGAGNQSRPKSTNTGNGAVPVDNTTDSEKSDNDGGANAPPVPEVPEDRPATRMVTSIIIATSTPGAVHPAPAPTRITTTATPPVVTPTPPAPSPSPSPSPAPAPAPAPPVNGGSASLGTDAQAWLDLHNAERAKRGAEPLVWDTAAAAAAQRWADSCTWGHSQGAVGPYGENMGLMPGTNQPLSPKGTVDMWVAEAANYRTENPVFSGDTGHWTQVVWKGTKKLGCAVSKCASISKYNNGAPGFISVCEYSPPGNMRGAFTANVQL